jgi:signal peptidase I
MFFLTPRYITEAKHYRHALKRVINYKKDILPPTQLAALEDLLARLNKAIKSKDREALPPLQEEVDKTVGKVAPPPKHAGWCENVEVFLVAIVIAAGVRAYILQPFRIPTGSMQPTLYGIVGTSTDTPPPNILKRAFDFVWLGRSYFDVVAKESGRVIDMSERTHLNFFTFTEITMDSGKYTVFAPASALYSVFGVSPGRVYGRGEPIVRGYIDTGDQVFVDKLSYHFVPPARGDVFVFRTVGIRKIQEELPAGVDSQHYIKRLAGLPGDELRIAAPNLFIDGKKADLPPFQKVMSMKNGYQGYANLSIAQYLTESEETFTVPQRAYFALGDNSYHSSDSRFWGIVPEQNVSGRGWFVYWPFSKRWGFIH